MVILLRLPNPQQDQNRHLYSLYPNNNSLLGDHHLLLLNKAAIPHHHGLRVRLPVEAQTKSAVPLASALYPDYWYKQGCQASAQH